MRHLLFIPVYNCENQIIRVIDKIIKSYVISNFEEIIIIDNNSKDNTFAVVQNVIDEKKLKQFKLFQNKNNYNLGGTHKTGFNYAIDNNFDYVTILHGDDQGDINNLENVFKNEKYKDYDCCLGSRFARDSKLVNYPKFRIYANYMINLAASIVSFKFLTDLGSGLNMFKVSFLKNKFYLNFPNGLTFNYCLMFYICDVNSKFFYFPILWREDDQVSNVKLFSHFFKWLEIMFKFVFTRKRLFQNKLLRDKEYVFKKFK
jgi:hypothetical protein